MRLAVHYNDSKIDLSLPDDRQVDLFGLPYADCEPQTLPEALPESECARIREFVLSNDSVVVINDSYRPTPTAGLLNHIFGEIDFAQLKILIATGVHPEPDREALKKLVGDEIAESASIHTHSAFAPEQHAAFDDADSQVKLNKILAEAEAILIIGSVEPHYFAGFTGGRKIIFPGCAAFADIQRNHAFAVSEQSQPLTRSGNPVWEDIWSRTRVLDRKKRLALQVCCNHAGEIYYATSGDWDQAYEQACRFVEDNASAKAVDPYDLVISVVYPPLDRNLYQLQKSYENVQTAVRDGGTILLISSCAEGIGDHHFIELARNLEAGEQTTRLGAGESGLMGIHKVKRTQRLAKRIKLNLFSELKQSDIEPLPITATRKLDMTIQELMENYGPSSRVAVVLDSASQVLYSDHIVGETSH